MLENTPPLVTQEETPTFTGSSEYSSSQCLYQPSQQVPSQLASPHKALSPAPVQNSQFNIESQLLTNSPASEEDSSNRLHSGEDLYERIFGKENEAESTDTNTPRSNLR